FGGNGLHTVELSPDGKLLASIANDGSLVLWETATGKKAQQIKGLKSPATCLALSPDSKMLVSRNADGKFLQMWDITTGKEVRQFGKAPEDQMSMFGLGGSGQVAFSPDGKTLVAPAGDFGQGGLTTSIKFWDVATGKELQDVKGPDGGFGWLKPIF